MMTKFMNKQRGLLAAIMALVMVFAGVVVVASDMDATTASDNGPLSFEGTYTVGELTASNDGLGNIIYVDYNSTDKKYTLTGMLMKQPDGGVTEEQLNKYTDSEKVFIVQNGNKVEFEYGLFLKPTTKITHIDGEAKEKTQLLWYIDADNDDRSKTKTFKIDNVDYTVDISGLALGTPLKSSDVSSGTLAGGNYYLTESITLDKTLTINGDTIINLNSFNLEVTGQSGLGIVTTKASGNDLTIIGKGNETLTVKTVGSIDEGRYDPDLNAYGIANFDVLTIKVKTDINATSGNLGVGIYGSTEVLNIDGAEVNVKAGNRGIYVTTVNITGGAEVTAIGHERGVSTSSGTITVSGEGTVLKAQLANIGKVNEKGEDDRMGLKVYSLIVNKDAKVIAQGAHLAGNVTVEGTLEIEYSDKAGRSEKTTGTGQEITIEKSAVPAGLILASFADKPALIGSPLTIIGSGVLKIDDGNAILGTIKTRASVDADTNDTVKFGDISNYVLTPIITGSDVTIKVGSVYVNGVLEAPVEGTITITGNATLSGTVDENITIDASGATKITVPADGLVLDGKIDFTGASAVAVDVVGDLTGYGSIVSGEAEVTFKKAPTSIVSVDTGNITPVTGKVDAVVGTFSDDKLTQEDANALKSKMEAATDITIETLKINDGVTLEIPANITVTLTGTIQVGTDRDTLQTAGGAELIIYGKIVAGGENAKSVKITVEDGSNLYLDGADVRVNIDAEENAYISVDNAKEMTVKGNSTADLGVGYGNTLILSDFEVDAGMSIDVYGTIIIEETVTIEKGAQFNVYASGNAQIDGALVIEGIANINGAADVNGSVKVYNADGNAAFNVAAGADVDVAGTMDVLVGKNKAQNTLTIEDVPTKDKQKGKMNFVVTGTLNITGTLDGAVYDMGTVAFNGTAAGTNAKIFIFDGMTITIASVNGQLTVEDKIDITDFITNEKASNSNNVVLNNVKNVTVSTEVTETVKENASKQKIRYYTLNMTVSGAVTSIDDTVTTEDYAYISINNAGASEGWADAKVDDRSITIGDVNAGKNVTIKINAVEATVAGTITIAAEGSKIVNSSTVAVDVDGAIVIVDKEAKKTDCTIGLLNAAAYEVEDKTGTAPFSTFYYTTLDAALAASAEDSNKTIDVFGTSEIASDLEVPAGITVDLATGAAMTIDVDGKLTVAATALLDASAGSVKVDGMLVIMDKDTGLNGESKLTYQVLNETETTATYSGLVLALQNAVAGDVITLKQDADITKSVTIPEGVTLVVPKNVTLTVGDDKDDVTLTVAGTLKVEGTVDEETTTKEIAVEVPGVIIKTGTLGVMPEDYVEFTMKIDGRLTTVYSNLAYAAANAVDGDVKVYGDISGGDVTFTVADKKTLTITVTTDSTLSVGTLTLVGAGASITTADAVAASGSTPAKEAGAITGTIAAAAGSVDLNKVSGIKIEVNVEETVDAKTDIMIVDDTTDGLSGSFTVASGTVTAATGFAMNASKDNKMSVASGATLLVDAVFTATGIVSGDDNYDVIIDGTISVIKNGKATIEYTTVNGTIDVASEGTLTIEGAIVNGTISVAEKTDDAAAGVANVNGALVLGTAPALGANGTFVGPVDIKNDANAYIIAYAGADVSAALIDVENGKSTAKSTEIVLNGVPYMTVYVDANSSLKLSALQKYFEVEGFETTVDWKDSIDGNTELASVNKIEGTLTAAKTKLTVSAGVGLKVYIDGLAIENFYGIYDSDKDGYLDDESLAYWIQFGTHTVSFAVESGYDGSAATITVNGVQVANGGTFTIDIDDKDVVIIASGAVPAQSGSTVVVDDADDGMALTDILLIVLVVLIVIMAIIVALRMMRS